MGELDNSSVVISLLVLSTIAIFVHGFGAALLSLQLRHEENIQRTLLINLSCVEILGNLFRIFISNFHVFYKDPMKRIEVQMEVFDLRRYSLIIANTGIYWLYLSSLIYITMNRMLEIKLNLKYQIYCTPIRVKLVLATSWIVAILICLILCIIESQKEFLILNSMDYYMVFVSAVLEIFYLILVILAYVFILHRV